MHIAFEKKLYNCDITNDNLKDNCRLNREVDDFIRSNRIQVIAQQTNVQHDDFTGNDFSISLGSNGDAKSGYFSTEGEYFPLLPTTKRAINFRYSSSVANDEAQVYTLNY